MNLLADESVERQIVERLRLDGHVVDYVAEMTPSIDDDVVLSQANAKGQLLLTTDKDFGELVYRQRLVHLGVILIRLEGLHVNTKADLVSCVFTAHGAKMPHAFTVISPGRARVRTSL